MVQLENKNILIISNEPWGDIWFSKHHYAWELSKRNNKVIFINPSKRWRPGNLFKRNIRLNKINENLTILDYSNFLPSNFLNWNNTRVSKELNALLLKNNFTEIIFWTFDPIRLFKPSIFGARLSIFHVMDKYQFVHPAEFETHRNVDGFIFVSNSFSADYAQYKKPFLVLPHAISPEEFDWDEAEENRINLPFEDKDFACYIGTVDERLDYSLIYEMAKRFPAIPFLFIGRYKEIGNELAVKMFIEKELANVFLIGPVPSKILKYYIGKCLFCIAPMSKQHKGNDISHHKIFQYLVRGKPVFSMVFKEYVTFRELLYMENDNDKLMDSIGKFLKEGEPEVLVRSRIDLVNGYTFDKHFIKIEEFFSRFEN